MATHDEWDLETGLQLLSDAGIDCLPEGWTVRQLGPMLSKERGVAVGVMYPGENTPGGIPLIRAGELTGSVINDRPEYYISPEVHHEYRRTALEGGELLVTLVGNVGLCAVVPKFMNGWNAARAIAVIRLENPSDACFIRLCLISPSIRHLMHSWCNTTVQATLNLKDLRLLPIPWPPPDVRAAIVRTVGSLDDKIEQNRRTGRKLEELARAVFKAWFVDFEPVKAKAAGGTAFPGMPPETFATLPKTLKDSPLGPVPEGWGVKPLSETVKLTMGQSPKSEFYNEEGRGLPFHQGVTDYGFRFPSDRVYCTAEGRIAESGDILLSVRAPVGRINVTDGRLILGRGLAGMRHVDDQQSFLLYQMFHVFAEEDAIGDGTIYKAVNKDYLLKMPLVVPPAPVRGAYEDTTRPMDKLIVATEKESTKLATLRDYLLPRLLSGRVRVRNCLPVAVDCSNYVHGERPLTAH
jgi:type I restriction enzyme S subunit